MYRALRGCSCGSRGFLEDRMMDIITGRAPWPPLARAESQRSVYFPLNKCFARTECSVVVGHRKQINGGTQVTGYYGYFRRFFPRFLSKYTMKGPPSRGNHTWVCVRYKGVYNRCLEAGDSHRWMYTTCVRFPSHEAARPSRVAWGDTPSLSPRVHPSSSQAVCASGT